MIKKDEMMTGIENFPSISYPDIVNREKERERDRETERQRDRDRELVQSYSTLNMQLEFVIQKLAQWRKHIAFCRVIIQLNTKKCAILIFQQLELQGTYRLFPKCEHNSD